MAVSISARTQQVRRLSPDWLEGALRVGLAGAFLVDALVAVLRPAGLTRRVERSVLRQRGRRGCDG